MVNYADNNNTPITVPKDVFGSVEYLMEECAEQLLPNWRDKLKAADNEEDKEICKETVDQLEAAVKDYNDWRWSDTFKNTNSSHST